MRSLILKVLGLMAILSLACTVSFNLPASRTGETETFTINEAEPASTPARLELEVIGGTLNITGGGSGLVSGTIEYNVPEWEPDIVRSNGTVRIEQTVDTVPFPSNGQGVDNIWTIQLGDTPLFLDIEAGAYDGNLNLSGIPLTGLEISGGASDSEIRFDSPNLQPMETFDYQTGASNVEIYGLSNANLEVFTFRGGAGDYLIDFGGTPTRPLNADIAGAVGDLTIVIPDGVASRIEVTGGLRDIDLEGQWTKESEGDIYTTAGSSPLLSILVEMSVGNLELAIR